MGGKSGGGYDAAPMIEYGEKALALQEQMYDDGVDRTEPFYQGGLGAFEMLLDGLGVNGGSKKSRDQVYDGMLDQYTTTETSGGSTGMWQGLNGQLYTSQEEAINDAMQNGNLGGDGIAQMNQARGLVSEYMPSTTTSVTDYDALNAAVDARMAEQGTPDNFGHLLETFGMDKFQADPAYQYRINEGNKAIERAAAARGQYYDPSTVKALNDHNANTADMTYNDSYNRHQNDQNSIFNRLAAVSGIGQTANNTMMQGGQNYANQAGNIYGQMGSAQVEANAANAAAPSMFDSLLGAGVQLGSAYLMSDERLKQDIKHIGEENGYPLYTFKYLGGDTTYRGVMAQDVEMITPEAVVTKDGFKAVNYDMINVKMEAV